MYRVLIVDDEPIFRIGLRSIVNWENYGFYVQDDAKNGLEALKIVEEDHPDLIFLDIKMPVMSGIDFLNAMKGNLGSTIVIVLSCFNEYDYVRESMKLGAYDYLFKPVIKPSDIEKILPEISEKLKENGADVHNIVESNKALKEELARITISDERNIKLALSFPRLDDDFYRVLCCGLIKRDDMDEDKFMHIRNSSSYFIQSFLSEFGILTFSSDMLEYYILFASEEPMYSNFDQKIGDLFIQLSQFTELNVWIGYSGIYKGSQYLWQAVHCAKYNEKCCYFLDGYERKTISHGISCDDNHYDYAKLYSSERQNAIHCFTVNDMPALSKILDIISADIRMNKYYSVDDYRHFITTLVVDSLRSNKYQPLLEKYLEKDITFISKLYYLHSMKETIARVMDIFSSMTIEREQEGLSDASKIINDVIHYINLHYAEKISLSNIEEKYSISASYFCKLFKSASGLSFVNYLNQVRVEKATQLLVSTNKKISDVAKECGFSDYPYFCKTYRKFTGYSPNEIRRNNVIN